MEVQLDRVKERRRERLEAEMEAQKFQGGKAKELRQGAMRKDRLKREIE